MPGIAHPSRKERNTASQARHGIEVFYPYDKELRVSFPVSHTRLVEPKRATGVLLSECKSEGGLMRNFSRGIWTWAALYVAFGLIGIFLLTGQSTIVTSSEGYGIAAIASPAPLR
jgi:hypothetical protein